MSRSFRGGQIVGIALFMALLVLDTWLVVHNARKLEVDAGWVSHSHEVLGSLSEIESTMNEAESGQRGYVITGDDLFLEPYTAALARIDREVAHLTELVSDSKAQSERLPDLQTRLDRRRTTLQHNLELRRDRTFDAARDSIATRAGEAQMVALREHLGTMAAHERALLAGREVKHADTYRVALYSGLIAGLTSLGLLVALVALLRRDLRTRADAADEVASQRELLQTTLASIGDAVIATDVDARVTFVNRVAADLTGWSVDEMTGRALDEVFVIVDEDHRRPASNPAKRALADGRIVGLANHTILVAKDGSERAIDDSAAPIRDANGKLVGAVLVFRDVTKQRLIDRALRESEARKAAMLDHALDCIITMDHEGKVVEFNPAAEATFGWKRDAVLGRDMADVIIPSNVRAQHRAGLARYLETGYGPVLDQRMQLVGLRADGEEFPVEITITAIQQEGHPIFTAYLRDITERLEDERELDERLQLLALGADIGKALTQADDLDALLQRCATALMEHLGCAMARVWTWNEAEQVLEIAASAGLAAPIDPAHARVRLGQGTLGKIAQEKRPRFLNTYPDDPELPTPHGITSAGLTAFAAYPLLVEERLVGIVKLFARHPLSETTLSTMASVANQIALGIERKRAEERVARLLASERLRSTRLGQVAAAASTLNSAKTQNSVVGVLENEARRIVGAQHASVRWSTTSRGAEAGALFVPLLDRSGKAMAHIEIGAGETELSQDDRAILSQLAHMGAVAIDNARLYEELRESDRRKDEFLATLSHELRNPLAPIRNAVEVMKLAEGDRDSVAWARGMIERQVQQLARLVDDLLDISRISRGKLELRRERIDLVAVTSAAIESSRVLIDEKAQELQVALPTEPIELFADATRLSQVVQNLLNNSTRYTPQGGRIWITVERVGAEAVVRVRDSGMGISAEMLPRVFDMFVQGEQGIERGSGGLGLGLTLVRTFVEMHSGSVEAKSGGAGLGSEFVVHLPLPVGAAVLGAGPASPSPLAAARTSRRVLVVDDNADSVTSLELMLRILGHDVATAHDGVEAVEKAGAFEPDLILLDIGLPRLNGYEAARQIRALPAGARVVLVAVTGWGQEEDRRRSRAAGFDHHIVKPVEPAAIERILERLDDRAT